MRHTSASMKKTLLFFCCLFFVFGSAIENKENKPDVNQFVGQLTSLLNQAGGFQGGEAVGYQSGGFPGRPFPGPLGPPYPGPPRPPYPGPPYPPPQQLYPGGYPGQGLGSSPNSLFGALSSIARYDDLRCVPRLLCEVASGARPGSYSYPSYSQESPLPFLSKDALVTLLTVLNFVDDSPLLVFGRAALLGYTARGDSRACLVAYPTCPRDPDHLVDYLNNHNGGFFRFFNQQLPQYAPQYQQYQPYPPPLPPYPQRPFPPPPGLGQYPPEGPAYPPRPYPPGGLFNPQRPYPSQSAYPPQGSYPPKGQYPPQRPLYSPRPPRPGYPQQYSSQNQRYQSRIQTNPDSLIEYNHYTSSTQSPIAESLNSYSTNFRDQIYDIYSNKESSTKSKLVFPQTDSQVYQYTSSSYNRPQHSLRGGKKLSFPLETSQDNYSYRDEQFSNNRLPYEKPITMVFPDRTGTGDLRLDLDEHGDFKSVYYASQRGLRQVKFPREHHKMSFPSGRSNDLDSEASETEA